MAEALAEIEWTDAEFFKAYAACKPCEKPNTVAAKGAAFVFLAWYAGAATLPSNLRSCIKILISAMTLNGEPLLEKPFVDQIPSESYVIPTISEIVPVRSLYEFEKVNGHYVQHIKLYGKHEKHSSKAYAILNKQMVREWFEIVKTCYLSDNSQMIINYFGYIALTLFRICCKSREYVQNYIVNHVTDDFCKFWGSLSDRRLPTPPPHDNSWNTVIDVYAQDGEMTRLILCNMAFTLHSVTGDSYSSKQRKRIISVSGFSDMVHKDQELYSWYLKASTGLRILPKRLIRILQIPTFEDGLQAISRLKVDFEKCPISYQIATYLADGLFPYVQLHKHPKLALCLFVLTIANVEKADEEISKIAAIKEIALLDPDFLKQTIEFNIDLKAKLFSEDSVLAGIKEHCVSFYGHKHRPLINPLSIEIFKNWPPLSKEDSIWNESDSDCK